MKENISQLKKLFYDFRKGNNESFLKIYQALKQPVFVISFRIVSEKEAAEDITQEIFLKLFQNPPDDKVSNPRAYVFQMAHNISIDYLRKKSFFQIEDIENIEIPDDDKFHNLIVGIDIERAMMKLTCIEREILSLHINGELTFFEIAKILQLSPQKVYRKYQKALKLLRDELNGGDL